MSMSTQSRPGAGADLGDERRSRAHPDAGEGAGCRRQRVAEGRAQTKRHVIISHRSVVAAARRRRAATHIGRVNDPARMISPASRRAPWWWNLFASHATPVAGWSSTPAATPVSVISPLRYSSAGTQRRSISSGRLRTSPEHHRPVGGVVGDRVDDRAALELDVRVEHLERGHRVVDRAQRVLEGAVRALRAAPSARTRARPRCARSRSGPPGCRRRSGRRCRRTSRRSPAR